MVVPAPCGRGSTSPLLIAHGQTQATKLRVSSPSPARRTPWVDSTDQSSSAGKLCSSSPVSRIPRVAPSLAGDLPRNRTTGKIISRFHAEGVSSKCCYHDNFVVWTMLLAIATTIKLAAWFVSDNRCPKQLLGRGTPLLREPFLCRWSG